MFSSLIIQANITMAVGTNAGLKESTTTLKGLCTFPLLRLPVNYGGFWVTCADKILSLPAGFPSRTNNSYCGKHDVVTLVCGSLVLPVMRPLAAMPWDPPSSPVVTHLVFTSVLLIFLPNIYVA